MSKQPFSFQNFKVIFRVEPADHSVGITSEGFTAWLDDGDDEGPYCTMVEYGATHEKSKFEWELAKTGKRIERPQLYGRLMEELLLQCADQFYRARNDV